MNPRCIWLRMICLAWQVLYRVWTCFFWVLFVCVWQPRLGRRKFHRDFCCRSEALTAIFWRLLAWIVNEYRTAARTWISPTMHTEWEIPFANSTTKHWNNWQFWHGTSALCHSGSANICFFFFLFLFTRVLSLQKKPLTTPQYIYVYRQPQSMWRNCSGVYDAFEINCIADYAAYKLSAHRLRKIKQINKQIYSNCASINRSKYRWRNSVKQNMHNAYLSKDKKKNWAIYAPKQWHEQQNKKNQKRK